jgi:hypothetical protein
MRGLFFGGTLAGILVGFVIGLALAWFYWPFALSGASPADLRQDFKDDYLRMIASSYLLDGDMALALKRLGTLNIGQADAYIFELIQREPEAPDKQALVHLALDLRQTSVALTRPTFTPRPIKTRLKRQPEPSTTLKAAPTSSIPQPATIPVLSAATAEPTSPPATSVPNPDAPLYLMRSRSMLNCLETGGRGLIEVQVQDSAGRPVTGVGVEVNWDTGDEVFFTGLKPERGLGYADAEVTPGTYRVRLTGGAKSAIVDNLWIDEEPEVCSLDAQRTRGWMLNFQRSE